MLLSTHMRTQMHTHTDSYCSYNGAHPMWMKQKLQQAHALSSKLKPNQTEPSVPIKISEERNVLPFARLLFPMTARGTYIISLHQNNSDSQQPNLPNLTGFLSPSLTPFLLRFVVSKSYQGRDPCKEHVNN